MFGIVFSYTICDQSDKPKREKTNRKREINVLRAVCPENVMNSTFCFTPKPNICLIFVFSLAFFDTVCSHFGFGILFSGILSQHYRLVQSLNGENCQHFFFFSAGHNNTQFRYGRSCDIGTISDNVTSLLWWYWGPCNSRIYCWIWTKIGQFYRTIDGNESGSISCLSTLCEVRGFLHRRYFFHVCFLLHLSPHSSWPNFHRDYCCFSIVCVHSSFSVESFSLFGRLLGVECADHE